MLRKEKKCFKLDLEIKELTIYTYVVYDIILLSRPRIRFGSFL